MKTILDKRLFWYLKDGTEIDLGNPSNRDMYVQQILSHGKAEDIKKMLSLLTPEAFRYSFKKIKVFLPKEVRIFWEEGFGDIGEYPKKDTQLP